MYRINAILERLQGINPAMLGAALVFAALILVFVPRRHYLGLAIAFLAAWLNLGRFNGLGALSALAKATFVVPFALVWLMATLQPGPRRKAPWVSWVYLAAPIIAMICVVTAADVQQAITYLLCFFLSAAAALQIVRRTVDRRSINYFFSAYGLGLLVPVLIIFFAFLVGGRQHYNVVHTVRFHPFGAGSNQVVPILMQAIAVGLFQFHAFRRFWPKLIVIVVVGISAGLALKTGSRQAFLLLVIFIAPYIVTIVRRPIILATFALIGIGGFYWIFAAGGEASHSQIRRATHLQDTGGRFEIALEYFDVIARRPAAGLMGSSGESIIASKEVGTHTHNAFIEMFYWGGLLLGTPLLLAVAMSLWSAAVVVWRRHAISLDPACAVILASSLLTVYMHGVAGNMIYVSIGTWPFYHFVLSGILVALRDDLTRSGGTMAQVSGGSPATAAMPH